MSSGRLENSIKNILSGVVAKVALLLLNFVVRTVFIRTLGNDYLGVNGLYSNILGMLSLAELGFGTAMVYNMYRPLAEKNDKKLAALLQLYRKVYIAIGTVVLAVGLALAPFLDSLIKDQPDVEHLTLYYLMYLGNSVLSYWFWGYRCSILTADQKEYIRTNIRTGLSVLKAVAQIVVLVCLHNFTVYLLIQLGATLLENAIAARKAEKMYAAFRVNEVEELTIDERKQIAKDVKSLAVTRVGHVALHSTDSIIISSLIGVTWVGLLSNYQLIVETITGVLCLFTGAITSSLGNYFAEKSRDEGVTLFRRVEFVNFWMYGLCSIALIVLLDPFIYLWLGADYCLDFPVTAVIVLNFFVQGYMNVLWTFRSAMGLFAQGWYRSLIVAAINLVLSVLLGLRWGVFGVLIATFVANAAARIWFDPLVIHKYGFGCSVKAYYISCVSRVGQVVCIMTVILAIRPYILQDEITVMNFTMLACVTAVIAIVSFCVLNFKRDEFSYIKDTGRRVIRKLRSRHV